ncbi:hypothetical protein N7532_005872 [Penicillium argentinense]|uniref:Uncharacterized protein n=1 Tax=Penicillium argentinense TaxID=1131581 RepID=A0A9W9FEU1_9EURO|nr:uncharacterized protein N7532_005872 [Penicillium argentinense]KAJ5098871.1 hypothetical protein N7532_005872 [Penicillium argentinense]
MDTSQDSTSPLQPQPQPHSSQQKHTKTAMTRSTQPVRRLLIFQETRNPQNTAEVAYLPVNKLGLPICGNGPDLPNILELPLRVVKAFTEIFNQPKYKGWYVYSPFFFHWLFSVANHANYVRSVLSAGPYHDKVEEGKFYAVVLEQTQGHQEMSSGT